MGRIEALMSCGNAGKCDHLVRLRIHARHINQTRRETDRSVFHSLIDESFHLLQLLRRGSAVTETHHLVSHRPMRDEGGEIDGERLPLDSPQELSDVGGRRAAVSRDQRRDAHPQEVFGIRLSVDRFNMRMNVYKAGGDYLPPSVYHLSRLAWIDVAYASDTSIF